MGDLRGFWKDQGPKPGKAAQRKKRKRPKRKWRNFNTEKSRAGHKFYLSEAWRKLRYVALKNAGGRCQACGASPSTGAVLHVDHIRPRSKAPHLELHLDNLQVLCEDCNLGKGAWDQTDWRGRNEPGHTEIDRQLDAEYRAIMG